MGKLVLDIGGTKLRWALWDGLSLNQIQESPTPKVSAPQFVDHLVHLLLPSLQKFQITEMGIASAGPVRSGTGELLSATNLGNGDSSWQHFQLKNELSNKTNVPIAIANDAASAALGQFHHFEQTKILDLVVVTLGTGLGVGAIVDGALVQAGQGLHPEVGHMLLGSLKEQPYPTAMGNFPTAESFLAGHHFAKRVALDTKENIDGKVLIQRSLQGDPLILKYWEQYRVSMASFLANLCLIYFPQKIVLAGGFAVAAAPYFLKESQSLLARILKKQVSAGIKLPQLELAHEPDLLPLFGAAYL